LAGVVWLLARRESAGVSCRGVPDRVLAIGRPHGDGRALIRYTVPLAPPLAVAAGGVQTPICCDTLAGSCPRRFATAIVVATTALYAVAYMNVFRQPDSRLLASRWLLQNVPANAKILVEPSQNTPPMGRT